MSSRSLTKITKSFSYEGEIGNEKKRTMNENTRPNKIKPIEPSLLDISFPSDLGE